jgi:hypothetical protein
MAILPYTLFTAYSSNSLFKSIQFNLQERKWEPGKGFLSTYNIIQGDGSVICTENFCSKPRH